MKVSWISVTFSQPSEIEISAKDVGKNQRGPILSLPFTVSENSKFFGIDYYCKNKFFNQGLLEGLITQRSQKSEPYPK